MSYLESVDFAFTHNFNKYPYCSLNLETKPLIPALMTVIKYIQHKR